MKQKTRWHDALVLAAVLCAAFLIVTGTQQITGRIDGVASMVFVLAVFLISIYTDGYVWGVVASLIGVLAVNFAFRSPYFAFNFTLPENLFSGMAMLVVSIMTSTLTTRIKKQEQLRMESETEKMRATLLRAVSHDLRTPLTSIYGACSTVIENYDSLEKEQKLKLLGEACSDAQWLNRMVENLLSVTRFDGGRAKDPHRAGRADRHRAGAVPEALPQGARYHLPARQLHCDPHGLDADLAGADEPFGKCRRPRRGDDPADPAGVHAGQPSSV